MKDLKKFMLPNGCYWENRGDDNEEVIDWHLCDSTGKSRMHAFETKRNNRGVQLETYLLNGGRTVFWLKPENGKFV